MNPGPVPLLFCSSAILLINISDSVFQLKKTFSGSKDTECVCLAGECSLSARQRPEEC